MLTLTCGKALTSSWPTWKCTYSYLEPIERIKKISSTKVPFLDVFMRNIHWCLCIALFVGYELTND